jgi:hypothetical protein
VCDKLSNLVPGIQNCILWPNEQNAFFVARHQARVCTFAPALKSKTRRRHGAPSVCCERTAFPVKLSPSSPLLLHFPLLKSIRVRPREKFLSEFLGSAHCCCLGMDLVTLGVSASLSYRIRRADHPHNTLCLSASSPNAARPLCGYCVCVRWMPLMAPTVNESCVCCCLPLFLFSHSFVVALPGVLFEQKQREKGMLRAKGIFST